MKFMLPSSVKIAASLRRSVLLSLFYLALFTVNGQTVKVDSITLNKGEGLIRPVSVRFDTASKFWYRKPAIGIINTSTPSDGGGGYFIWTDTVITTTPTPSLPKLDTVAAVLFLTNCDDCFAISKTGYVVYSWRPNLYGYSPDSYAPSRELQTTEGYLDSKKKPFGSKVMVWDYKLK